MKKYILGLFAIVLMITFINVHAANAALAFCMGSSACSNSASAYPPGCTSNSGFSSTTGNPCNPHPTPIYPPGCTSNSGYSSTTGNPCNPHPAPIYPPGCTSNSGYSSTTGNPCNGHPVLPTPPAPTVCAITQSLKMGSMGQDVACMQSRLGIIPDGKFGLRTKIIVQALQTNARLNADGVVTPKNISALELAN